MNMVSKRGLLILLALGAAGAFAGTPVSHDGHFPGLMFDLKVAGAVTPGLPSTYGNLYDAMSWSRPSGRVCASHISTFDALANPDKTTKFGTPEPVRVDSIDYQPNAYFWTNLTENALVFPQPMKTFDNGDGTVTTNIYQQAVVFPQAVQTGSNATLYVRFRWDGNLRDCYEQVLVENGWLNSQKAGFALTTYLTKNTKRNDLDNDAPDTKLRLHIGNQVLNIESAYPSPTPGVWYEVVFSMKAEADGTHVSTYFLICSPGYSSGNKYLIKGQSNQIASNAYVSDPVGSLVLGARGWNGVTNRVTWVDRSAAANTSPGSGFRGAISRLRIYNRALSEDECLAILNLSEGSQVAVGSANGSGDEFAAAADAVSPFEPLSMPARMMRKTLDAAHPELTLKFPMHEDEEGLPRVLQVSAISEGAGERMPVTVSVNGRVCDEPTLRDGQEAAVFVPGEMMTRDPEGNVTLAVRRSGTPVGKLHFDALKFSGSWALGKADGKRAGEWCVRSPANVMGTHQDSDLRHRAVIGAIYNLPFTTWELSGQNKNGGYYYRVENILFNVPKAVAEELGGLFTLGVASFSDYSRGRFSVALNGETVIASQGVSRSGEQVEIPFGPGVLKTGMNCVTISNATDNVGGASNYNTLNIDNLKFTFEPPKRKKGLMIILR